MGTAQSRLSDQTDIVGDLITRGRRQELLTRADAINRQLGVNSLNVRSGERFGMLLQRVATPRGTSLSELRRQVAFGIVVRRPTLGSESQTTPDLLRRLIESEKVETARRLLTIALRSTPVSTELLDIARVLARPEPHSTNENDVDRHEEYRWIAMNASRYRGQWLALLGDRIVGSAPSLSDLYSMLAEMNLPAKPLVHRVE